MSRLTHDQAVMRRPRWYRWLKAPVTFWRFLVYFHAVQEPFKFRVAWQFTRKTL